jgi:hypothetical protein
MTGQTLSGVQEILRKKVCANYLLKVHIFLPLKYVLPKTQLAQRKIKERKTVSSLPSLQLTYSIINCAKEGKTKQNQLQSAGVLLKNKTKQKWIKSIFTI